MGEPFFLSPQVNLDFGRFRLVTDLFMTVLMMRITEMMMTTTRIVYDEDHVDDIGMRMTITALFTNMRILKFKSQLFAAVNHLNGPLRKQNFTLTGSKRQGL